MRILLIEPDFLQAATYEKVLTRAGHQVARAVSAQAAVHLADEHMPDLVLLELQLPNHNGVEFLYEFAVTANGCTYHHHPHLRAAARAGARQHIARELGVVRTLYKPATSLNQLCAAVVDAVPVPS
ncbi:MAG: response regulator [Candidatus Saccharibacteria bacterium]